MNIKRIAIVGCAVALVGAMTATAFAGTITGNGMNANKGQQATLTAAQVADNAEARAAAKEVRDATREARQADRDVTREDRQAERAEMTAAWDALTTAQQEEVYQLHEDKINAEMAIVDKYLALGLIDADRAAEMKTNLTERLADLRTDGHMVMMGGLNKGPHENNANCIVDDENETTAK